MDDWSDLDEASLVIFGEHPALRRRPSISRWPAIVSGLPGQRPPRSSGARLVHPNRAHRKRPFRGQRPTLSRDSVEDFAQWWHQRQREREARRRVREEARAAARQRLQRVPPQGWLTTRRAADLLGISPGHVLWLLSNMQLDGRREGRSWWLSASSVDSLVERRRAEERWVSAVEAAAIVGCSPNAMLQAAKRGEIEQRSV